MPEIIEIDFLRQEINSQLIGKTVADSFLNKEKASNVSRNEFAGILRGKSIIGARRKGKVLILDFTGNISIIVHFLLTGYMRLSSAFDISKLQAGIIFSDGNCLCIGGLMGNAFVRLIKTSEVFLDRNLKVQGVDALSPDFTLQVLEKIILLNPKKFIKQALTDQHLIAGIGNAYSDEILFKAKILPTRRCGTLSNYEEKALYESIFLVFEEARAYGGESELSFVHLNGEKGHFNEHFKVHKREFQKCNDCDSLISSTKIDGRKTYFCSLCQK